MAIQIDGIIGEQKSMVYFLQKEMFDFFQSDLIVEYEVGKYFIVESKYQNVFEPPPIWGHGLPPRQIEKRQKFLKDTGIPCMFLVFDKNNEDIYWQWLNTLIKKNDGIYTKTKSRFIFPIDGFVKEKWTEKHEKLYKLRSR